MNEANRADASRNGDAIRSVSIRSDEKLMFRRVAYPADTTAEKIYAVPDLNNRVAWGQAGIWD